MTCFDFQIENEFLSQGSSMVEGQSYLRA